MGKVYNAIGLMSGTSLDGVDVAWLETDGEGSVTFKGSAYHPYDADFKQRMMAMAAGDVPLTEVLRLEKILTEHHAEAVRAFLCDQNLSAKDVDIIGFHGQTIRHLPDEGLTWQLGNASLLAARTGIRVCADMRRRDMAAGGQGAPLAPLYHAALFDDEPRPTAILNIGGVSNLTYIGEEKLQVIAGDCGPGMGLLDAFVSQKTDNEKAYDEDGAFARLGSISNEIIQKALSDIAFFHRPFPRSADRYDFDAVSVDHLSLEDGCATLARLTVDAIVGCVNQLPVPPKSLWVTGGGAKNFFVMDALQEALPECAVKCVEEKALRSDSMEAECFAWLAVRALRGLPLSVPQTTGCESPVSGGILTV